MKLYEVFVKTKMGSDYRHFVSAAGILSAAKLALRKAAEYSAEAEVSSISLLGKLEKE